jgi:hypothetical protein
MDDKREETTPGLCARQFKDNCFTPLNRETDGTAEFVTVRTDINVGSSKK